MQIKLDERLQAVANLIPPSITIGDIGTDHGYLLIDRISSGANPTGIGCDLRPGPLDSAKKNITLAGLNSQIDLRLGDGLSPLHPSEVQWVTIAGVGGGTMKSILQESPIIWHSLEGLVCQPQSDGGELRKFLADSNWKIEKEELVLSNDRVYEMFRAIPGKMESPKEEILWEIGPLLWEEKHPLLIHQIEKLIFPCHKILGSLAKAFPTKENADLVQMWQERLARLEGYKKCLSESKM